MINRRTLIVLSAAFLGAILLAVAVMVGGRKKVEGKNPLGPVGKEDVVRVVLTREGTKNVLVNDGKRWLVDEPYKDWADPQAMDRVLTTLQEFSVGSVVSENPERYDQFEVDEARATRVEVFTKGAEKPVLDGYVGKAVSGMGTAYFRYAEKRPVYLARNLAPWVLAKDPQIFRLSKAIPGPVSGSDGVRIEMEDQTLDLIRSSETWLRAGSEQVPDPGQVSALFEKLNSLYSQDFVEKAPADKDSGLLSPAVVVTVTRGQDKNVLRIGNKVPASEGKGDARYARLAGRDILFSISANAIDEVIVDSEKILSSDKSP